MNRIRLDSLTNKVQSAGRRLRTPGEAASARSEWAIRRGDQRYAGTFDVIGNFPGFEEFAGLIVNVIRRCVVSLVPLQFGVSGSAI